MSNRAYGLIEIEITQEHIDALQVVYSKKKQLQDLLDEIEVVPRLFGLYRAKVPKYTDVEARKMVNCFMVDVWQNYRKVRYAITKRFFDELNVSIRNCSGKKIYLELNNYDSLCNLMDWYRRLEPMN
jgi:hypothetical protein